MATQQTTDDTSADDKQPAWLSPEEQAALADGDETAELDEIINEGDENEDEDGAEGEEADAVDGEADEDNKDGEAAAGDGAEGETSSAVVDTPAVKAEKPDFMPHMDDSPVENYDQKMADIESKRTDLIEKLDNGDIDLKEYTNQGRALDKQEIDLKLAQRDAANAAKYNQGVAQQRWEWEQKKFFDTDANKIYSTDTKLQSELDKAVKYLASDPENGDKDGEWFLQEANELVRARFPKYFGDAKQNDTKTEKQEPKKEPKSAPDRKPDLSGIPKTLGNLPNAETDGQESGEFAYLDGLSGLALEKELLKISKDPEKEARYLRS